MVELATMGLTKKEKERMKKMTEERWRKRSETKKHEARDERGTGENGTGDNVRGAMLGAERRHQPADTASATPPPPPLPTTSNPASRSSFKLDHVPEVEMKDTSHRRYRIVDIENVIEWATRFAMCKTKPLNNDLTQ